MPLFAGAPRPCRHDVDHCWHVNDLGEGTPPIALYGWTVDQSGQVIDLLTSNGVAIARKAAEHRGCGKRSYCALSSRRMRLAMASAFRQASAGAVDQRMDQRGGPSGCFQQVIAQENAWSQALGTFQRRGWRESSNLSDSATH